MKLMKNLCTPAYVYLLLSVIFLAVSTVQNYGNINTYCLGEMSCSVPSTFLVFLIKAIYVLFWTWILNLICGAGYKSIAWVLVLLPFMLLFVLLLALLFQ